MSNHKAVPDYRAQTRESQGVSQGLGRDHSPHLGQDPSHSSLDDQELALPGEQWYLWLWLHMTLTSSDQFQSDYPPPFTHTCAMGLKHMVQHQAEAQGGTRICRSCTAGQTAMCSCSSLRVGPGEQDVAHVLVFTTMVWSLVPMCGAWGWGT